MFILGGLAALHSYGSACRIAGGDNNTFHADGYIFGNSGNYGSIAAFFAFTGFLGIFSRGIYNTGDKAVEFDIDFVGVFSTHALVPKDNHGAALADVADIEDTVFIFGVYPRIYKRFAFYIFIVTNTGRLGEECVGAKIYLILELTAEVSTVIGVFVVYSDFLFRDHIAVAVLSAMFAIVAYSYLGPLIGFAELRKSYVVSTIAERALINCNTGSVIGSRSRSFGIKYIVVL